MWLTTDKHCLNKPNAINSWDLISESLIFKLQPKQIKGAIVDIVDIPFMKLVAIASLDKIITVWDMLN